MALVLHLSFGIPCPAQEESSSKPKIVCLHNDDQFYYSFAKLLCEFLKHELGDDYLIEVRYRVRGRALAGAMDIVAEVADAAQRDADAAQRDESPTYYLGLTQSDVAYYFLHGGHPLYYTPHRNRSHVVALAKAFPEYFQIYSHEDPECSVPECIAVNHYQRWLRLRTGPLGSGSLITYTNVHAVVPDLEKRRDLLIERAFLPELKKRGANIEGPWGQTQVSAIPDADLEERLKQGEGCLIELGPTELNHLTDGFSQFYFATDVQGYGDVVTEYRCCSASNPGHSEPTRSMRMLGTPAILVAGKGLPGEVAARIVDFLKVLDGAGAQLHPEVIERVRQNLDNARNNIKNQQQLKYELAGADAHLHPEVIESVHQNPPDATRNVTAEQEPRFELETQRWRRIDVDSLLVAISHYANGRRWEKLVLPRHRAIAPSTFLVKRRFDHWSDYVVNWEISLIIVALVLFSLPWSKIPQEWKRLRFVRTAWFRQISGVSLVIIAGANLCLLLVSALEYRDYVNYKVGRPSPYIQYSYWELFPKVVDRSWARTFSEEDLFPESWTAQIVMGVFSVLTLGGLLFILRTSLNPLARHLAPHLKGFPNMKKIENHFVICNWHEYATEVIRGLSDQERTHGRDDPEIVVLTPDLNDIEVASFDAAATRDAAKRRFEGTASFTAYAGDPADPEILEKVRPWTARAVIIFPKTTPMGQSDSDTGITVLNIDHLVKKNAPERFMHERQGDDEAKSGKFTHQRQGDDDDEASPRVVVWCANLKTRETLLGLPRVVDACSTEWAWRLVCQATQVKHVSNIYRRLMTTSEDSNEIYEITIPEDKCTFSKLQQWSVDYNRREAPELNIKDQEGNTIQKQNTILLLGCYKEEDRVKAKLNLNPDPELGWHKGDNLLLLSYTWRKDRKGKNRKRELENSLRGWLEENGALSRAGSGNLATPARVDGAARGAARGGSGRRAGPRLRRRRRP